MANRISHTHQALPKLAELLIRKLGVPNYRDELIGDMQEEYGELMMKDPKTASRWMWRQTLLASWEGQKSLWQTPLFVNVITGVFTAMLLIVIVGFVVWLSNMDSTTPLLWEQTLNGQIHYIVFSPDFWQQATFAVSNTPVDIFMFMNVPSVGWAMAWAVAMFLLSKRYTMSPRMFSVVGMALSAVPYIVGYTVINTQNLDPKQIGPILAYMLIAPLYILPMLSAWAFFRNKGSIHLA